MIFEDEKNLALIAIANYDLFKFNYYNIKFTIQLIKGLSNRF